MAKKQKQTLFEEVQFKDIKRAERAVALAKINKIRILIGFVIAVVSTIFTALAIWGKEEQQMSSLGIAFVLAAAAYIIGGGIFKALGVAWKITKIGWFLVPMFPADILIALACFIFSVFGLFFVPIIFVGLNYINHKKTYDAAVSYLALYATPAEEAPAEEAPVEVAATEE